jgi:hypothetical protein
LLSVHADTARNLHWNRVKRLQGKLSGDWRVKLDSSDCNTNWNKRRGSSGAEDRKWPSVWVSADIQRDVDQ